ncbi:hypothetical protein HanIR_Chr04g0200661 [Helianthus annuus]|nr:hypothetical protein HanIR_Chr04g0200661 [Helianthus annuus]
MAFSDGVLGEEQADEMVKLVWLVLTVGSLKFLLYISIGFTIMPLTELMYRCSRE